MARLEPTFIGGIAALVAIVLIAGCSPVERASTREGATSDAAPAPAPAAKPPPAPATAARAPTTPAPVAKAPPTPAPAFPPGKEASAAPTAQKPDAPPPLDLAALEARLKETKGIGIMTKLALKNQVDDLLDQFRDYYRGRLKTTLADLHKAFDLLVLKVLSLLQDSDPSLARAIAASRDAIWSILADPAKFAKFAAL